MNSSTASRSVPSGPAAARRSLAPDLARGLMLALIALANVSWLLWGHDSVGMTAHVPAEHAADAVLQFVMTVAVDQRALPLFAFLFGYGMVQFHRSRIDRGIEPRIVRIMLRRRHWGMLLLGLAHAALLFYGDVLGAYAIAALLLVWIFFGRRDRTLRIWIGVVAGIMALASAFMLVGGVTTTLFAPADVISEMNASTDEFSPGAVRDLAYGQPYLTTVLVRTLMWIPITIQGALLVVVPLAIMIGWLAARHRILDEPGRHERLLRRVAIIGITIGWLGGLPDALMNAGLLPLPEGVYWMFIGLNYLAGLACGLGYAALFGLLAARTQNRTDGGPGPVGRAISAVGQRSLTFYLLQSVILAPLMAAWGIGLGQHLSTTGALAIALTVWGISLPIAYLMDRRSMRGPAELLLRRMTYGRHDPQVRSSARAQGTASPPTA